MTVGDRIRARRIEIGLCQRAFARRVGADPRRVYAWERQGVIPSPHGHRRLTIARVLRTTWGRLTGAGGSR